jgi:hypothetical protein
MSKVLTPLDKLSLAKSLGEHIDALYTLREWRIELERKIDEIKEKERLARYDIINTLRADKLEGSRGEVAVVRITTKKKPVIAKGKWEEFWTWARKDKNGTYVQKRIGEAAVMEQLDAGREVPGVYVEEIEDLSITKSA